MTDETPVASGSVRILPAMDNFVALRQTGRDLVDSAYHDVPVSVFNSRGVATLASMSQSTDGVIVRDGSIVGLWAWDPRASECAVSMIPAAEVVEAACTAECARVAALIGEVGHARLHSLDTDVHIQARADRIRALTWP